MNFIRTLVFGYLVAMGINLTGCDERSPQNRSSNMIAFTPRLQSIFEDTKTVCFGRFMVEVPESTTVAWGHASMVLGVDFYPKGATQVMEMAKTFSENLKNTNAIYLNYIPIFLSEEEITHPPGKIISGLEGFDAINELEIKGYFRWGDEGLVISARPLREDRADTIAEMKSIVQRLRRRDENDVPREAGNCLEYAFLVDKPATSEKPPVEHVRIGFRLKEFPDTHLSIYIGPSNPYHSEGNSLEWQLARREKEHRAESLTHPLLRTKYFRRGPRQIHDWLNGWEAVSRSPDQPGIHGIHDFVLDVKGVPKDVFKPYADIRMQTGVEGNLAGAVKPSLTDEEAIAVWDKITNSIRVRPTSAAPAKTGSAPRLPLGEKVATGTVCPQGGWWESSASGLPQAGRRQRFRAGDAMPSVIVAATPTLWQKIKGERPTFKVAGVWTLVGYDDEPAASQTSSTQSAPVSPLDREGGA